MSRALFRSSVAVGIVVALAAPLVAAAPTGLLAQGAKPAKPTASSASTSAAAIPTAPAPTTTASATPSNDDKLNEAKDHFNRGVELMQNEAWDAALVEFDASIALVPTKNATKNAAVCLRELHRFDESLAMYQQLIANFGPKLTPQETDTANKAIEDLKKLTGFIVVRSNVDGATVVIDGKDRGKTPLPQPVLVSSGTHNVRVSKEGYLPFEANQAVVGQATQNVDANLEALAKSGRLKVVENSGKILDVLVDGAVVGKTPYEGPLAPGAHSVVLHGDGRMGTQPAAANIVVDQTFVLRVSAEELKADARIDPDPAAAAVAIDGVPVGNGVWEGWLRVGQHKVDVNGDGYFGKTQTFDAAEGKKAEVKIILDRDENSPFWSKGRRYAITFSLFGSFAFGKSLGGDYENCSASGTTCSSHSPALGGAGGVRAGYEIAPGLGVELELGYAFFQGKVTRQTALPDESSINDPVNITDSFSLRGFFVGAGASYAFLRRPIILAGALDLGVILGKIRESRTGTGTADAAPTTRDLVVGAVDPVNKITPYFRPEVRLSYPISDRFDIGLALGVLIGVSGGNPAIKATLPTIPTSDIDPTTGRPTNPQYQGKPVGFVPHTATQESAVGTFILPQASIFARIGF